MIADAARPDVLADISNGLSGVGTYFRPHERRLPARKLWIAFAVRSVGTLIVDDGAKRALIEHEASLLPAGIIKVQGDFEVDQAVEIATIEGSVFAKGLARQSSLVAKRWAGSRTAELPAGSVSEGVHRDDLVILV